MQVTQKVNVHTFMSSELKKLNSKLHNIIIEHSNNEDMGAMMTSWYHDDKNFHEIVKVVRQLIINANLYDTDDDQRIWELHLKDLWGQIYNEGAHQVSHHHNPHSWSFCYYVNTPKGSSPIVFDDGSEVIAEEGKIVFFPSWLYHSVPPNKCKDRSVVCGNFIYKIIEKKHVH